MLDEFIDGLDDYNDSGYSNPSADDIMIEPDGPYMPEEPVVPVIPDSITDDIIRPEGIGASNPYASGFDEEHPLPTYKELRNAGFSDFEANKIIYGTYTIYSEKELFECLYGSDDPKAAYDAIILNK